MLEVNNKYNAKWILFKSEGIDLENFHVPAVMDRDGLIWLIGLNYRKK